MSGSAMAGGVSPVQRRQIEGIRVRMHIRCAGPTPELALWGA
jgi:hypothetical protein